MAGRGRPGNTSGAMDADDQPADDQPTAAPDTTAGRRRDAGESQQSIRWIAELVTVVVLTIVIAILLRTFVVATYSIPSGSMEPTLPDRGPDRGGQVSYHLHGVGAGNIVVFSTPPHENCAGPPVADLVKRVIGLPGETISLASDHVFINGHVLPEPWLPAPPAP